MALSEDQTRVLGLYHDYLRQEGLCVCERVARPDGSLAHRPVLGQRGKEMIEGFAGWRERQEGQEGQEGRERQEGQEGQEETSRAAE